MLKKIKHALFWRDVGLRERTFRMMLLVSGVVVSVDILECMLLKHSKILLFLLFVVLILIIVASVDVFKYHKMNVSAILIGGFVIGIVFPYKFIFNGGTYGGAMVWLVLGFIYMFIMFSGKTLICFLIETTTIDLCTYIFCYYHPEIVKPLESELVVYVDSFFSIVIVGVAVGIIMKYQIRILEQERTITQNQKEELERINKSKNAFFANMSHEIRTPINTIIGLNELILRYENSDETKECAKDIHIASELLLKLVNEILDLSQIEVDKMKIVPVAYDTRTLIKELIEIVRVQMREKKLDFFVDVDNNLPVILYGDEKRITQILLNILTNAVKYTSEGSVTFSVNIERRLENSVFLRFSVADTGVGIRKEDLTHLFEAFKRVDEKNSIKIEGSGLGLAITKQLVELMGGEITVDSIYTKGSVFTVVLEQKIIDKTPIGNVDFRNFSDNSMTYDYKRRFEAPEVRILIVDDNKMNGEVTKKLLEPTKMQVDIARSGQECLKKTRQKYYHIILMDYMMPGLSGVETLKELRKQKNGLCRDSSVILLTAEVMSGTNKLQIDNGFDGYLEKPVYGARLEEEIYKLLPEDVIEYQSENNIDIKSNTIRNISKNKRKKVFITTDCVSDLPDYLIEKYNIKIMNLYIKTDTGRFEDKREVTSDALLKSWKNAVAGSVLVEEYELFFAELLTQADYVIHISMSGNIGESYSVASKAAQGFDHVSVIDSEQISGGQGLIVLNAARMAMEQCDYVEIIEAISKLKKQVENIFIMSDVKKVYRNGYIKATTARACEKFKLYPIFKIQKNNFKIISARTGRLENVWKSYIRTCLFNKRKIDTRVLVITQIGCSVKQINFIKEEILKIIPFEKIIIQNGSCSNACYIGSGTIGIAYYLKE